MARTKFAPPPGNGSLCESCSNCMSRTLRVPGGSVTDDRTQRFCDAFMGQSPCPPLVVSCDQYSDRNQQKINSAAWKIEMDEDGDIGIYSPPRFFMDKWHRKDSNAQKALASAKAEDNNDKRGQQMNTDFEN